MISKITIIKLIMMIKLWWRKVVTRGLCGAVNISMMTKIITIGMVSKSLSSQLSRSPATHLPIQQQTWSHVLEKSFCHRSTDNATAAEEQQPPHLWNVTTINGKSLKYLNISSFKHFLQIFHIWSRRGKEVSVWLLLPDFADSASRLIPGYTQLILDIWAGHKNTCDFIIV